MCHVSMTAKWRLRNIDLDLPHIKLIMKYRELIYFVDTMIKKAWCRPNYNFLIPHAQPMYESFL